DRPVRGARRPARERQRRGLDRVDAEELEAEGGPGDVDDRVDRADLVEVDVVDRGAVDLRLGGGEPLEDGARARAGALREFAPSEDREHRAQAALGPRARLDRDAEARGRDRATLLARYVEPEAAEAEGVETGPELVEASAGVDERAERHVPRDPADEVEVGDA